MLAVRAFSVGLIGLILVVFLVVHRIAGSKPRNPKLLLLDSLMRRVDRPSAPRLNYHGARR